MTTILKGFIDIAKKDINTDIEVLQAKQPKKASMELIEISNSQIQLFEEKSEILTSMYMDKTSLNGTESVLQNNMTLTNYQIKVESDYIKVVDTITNYQYAFFSLGNKKLLKNNNTVYLIWNITQQLSCKYATKECKKKCYANKAYNGAYRNVKSRSKNLVLSTLANFTDIFNEVLEVVNSMYKNVFIRIHESGDFYNVNYYNNIMDILTNNKFDNKALIYTKNIEVLPLIKLNTSNNVTIRYSIMNDTPQQLQNIVLTETIPTFICVEEEQINEINNNMICPGACTSCLKCWNKDNTLLFVKRH